MTVTHINMPYTIILITAALWTKTTTNSIWTIMIVNKSKMFRSAGSMIVNNSKMFRSPGIFCNQMLLHYNNPHQHALYNRFILITVGSVYEFPREKCWYYMFNLPVFWAWNFGHKTFYLKLWESPFRTLYFG
jgi:hypothetical protein